MGERKREGGGDSRTDRQIDVQILLSMVYLFLLELLIHRLGDPICVVSGVLPKLNILLIVPN